MTIYGVFTIYMRCRQRKCQFVNFGTTHLITKVVLKDFDDKLTIHHKTYEYKAYKSSSLVSQAKHSDIQ